MNNPHAPSTSPSDPDSGPLRWLLTTILLFAMFGTGWLGSWAWANRSTINQLFYMASEQRYLTMAGEVGPVTYLIHHNDLSALEQLKQQRDDIIGVEVFKAPSIAAMAFSDKDAEAISLVAQLPGVTSIERRFVAMVCH